jgi:hypothetical protein
MIEKIISCAQSGAARAALDIAIKLGMPYGGWAVAGDPAAVKYRLERMPGCSFKAVSEKAVAAARGSLFFHAGRDGLSLHGQFIQKAALHLNKPFLKVDLSRERGFAASRRVAAWIVEQRVSILHVDGDDDGRSSPAVADDAAQILEASIFLATMQTGVASPLQSVVQHTRHPRRQAPPTSLEAALNHLQASLSLKDKATIANLAAEELVSLHFTLGEYINTHFDLFTANIGLLSDCRRRSGRWDLAPEGMAAVIIRALWERLRDTCRIRIVK